MSLLAWFRGLFGRPTKKRQTVDNNTIYAIYEQDPNARVFVNGVKHEPLKQYRRYDTFPKPGKLNELEVRFILSRFATSTLLQVARKLNKMGYLTPRGKKWNVGSVSYWRKSEQELQAKRERCREYDRTRRKPRQPRNVIFRNADLRQRQNGIN